MDNGTEIINRWNLDEWGMIPHVFKVSLGYAAQLVEYNTLNFKEELYKDIHYVNWFTKPEKKLDNE